MPDDEYLKGICRSCRKPWKEILSAGAEYREFERDGIVYTHHTIGSGVTKHNCISFKTEADWLKKRRAPNHSSPSTDNLFDKHIADLERDALQTLKAAGLPTVAGEDEPHLNEQGRRNRLLQEIEERGFREHIDKEWYAATILARCASLRDFITEGADIQLFGLYAFLFGGLIREAEIRFGFIAKASQKGGIAPKFDPAIMNFVTSRLRKNSTVTANTLLKELAKADSFNAVRIGKAKLFTEHRRIKVYRNGTESGGISFSSFPRYVTEARKRLSLPSPKTRAK